MSSDGDFKLVSRRRWLDLFVETVKRNVECKDRFSDDMDRNNISMENLEYAAENVAMYEEITEANRLLGYRERTERGYNLYGIDKSGVPLLIPVTRDRFDKNYDAHGNLRMPWYVV